jgi:protocatechuate 3,4-dioxygenase beta subunit
MVRLFTVILMLSAMPAMAQSPASCTPTPFQPAVNYPGARHIVSSNDLTAPAGKAVTASGEKLVIMGRVLDKNCVPLQGAVVELWQANPYGALRLASAEDRVNTAPVFSGAGRTVTDNDGVFTFTTVFPGSLKNQGPRLNFRVIQEGIPQFNTVFFFENDERNMSDPLYKRLKVADRASTTISMSPLGGDDGFIGNTIIVLPHKIRYRTY